MNWQRVKEILQIDIIPWIPSFPSISMSSMLSGGRGWRYHFLHQLSAYVNAGMSLQESVRVSLRQGSFNMRRALRDVEPALDEGQTLSDALLLSAPRIFPRPFYAMMKIGEMTGTLAEILRLLEKQYDEATSSRVRIIRALIYPAMVLTVGSSIVVFLLVKVLPTFAEIFHDLGSALPLPTRILVGISGVFLDYSLFPFVCLALLLLFLLLLKTLFWLFRVNASPLGWIWRRLPFIGQLMHHGDLFRFSSLMSALFSTGMSAHEALSLCESGPMHQSIRNAVKTARMKVAGGSSLSEAISTQQVFSSTLAWLVSVGEQKGELADSFKAFAEMERARINEMLELFRRLFEPAILLSMSCVVSFVVVALWLPVLKISELI
jgi:type IV pilus assembly protein PilC